MKYEYTDDEKGVTHSFKCEKCDNVVIEFNYEDIDGSMIWNDKNAVIYCSDCKNLRGEIASTQQIPAPVENMAKLQTLGSG